jgi:hypothetical protein
MEPSAFDSIRTLLGTNATSGSRVFHSHHTSGSSYSNLLSAVRKAPGSISDEENELRKVYEMRPGAGVSLIFYFYEFKRLNHLKYSWRMIQKFKKEEVSTKEVRDDVYDKFDHQDSVAGILCTLSCVFNKPAYDAWVEMKIATARDQKDEMKAKILKLVTIFKRNKHTSFGQIWMYAWRKKCFEHRFNTVLSNFYLHFDEKFEHLKEKGFEIWKKWAIRQSAKHKLKARLHLLKFRSFQNRKLFTVIKCMETHAKLNLVQFFLRWREQAVRLTSLRKKEEHQAFIDNTIRDHTLKIESLTSRLKDHEIQITKEKVEAEILNMMIELLDGVHIV